MNDWLNDLFNRKSWQTSGHWHHVSVSWSISRRPGNPEHIQKQTLGCFAIHGVSMGILLWRSLCFATDGLNHTLSRIIGDFRTEGDMHGNMPLHKGKQDVFSTGKTHWHLDTPVFRSSYRASPRTWTVWMQLPHLHRAWLQVAIADDRQSRLVSFHISFDPEIPRPCARAVRTATGTWGFSVVKRQNTQAFGHPSCILLLSVSFVVTCGCRDSQCIVVVVVVSCNSMQSPFAQPGMLWPSGYFWSTHRSAERGNVAATASRCVKKKISKFMTFWTLNFMTKLRRTPFQLRDSCTAWCQGTLHRLQMFEMRCARWSANRLLGRMVSFIRRLFGWRHQISKWHF